MQIVSLGDNLHEILDLIYFIFYLCFNGSNSDVAACCGA